MWLPAYEKTGDAIGQFCQTRFLHRGLLHQGHDAGVTGIWPHALQPHHQRGGRGAAPEPGVKVADDMALVSTARARLTWINPAEQGQG